MRASVVEVSRRRHLAQEQAEAEAIKRAQLERRSYIPHDPTAKQASFLALTCDEALFGGQAGGGKSDALLMDAIADVDKPGYAAILFRKTHTDLALPGALLDRANQWLTGTAAHWDGLAKAWRFPSGASLSFGYLDTPKDHFRYQSAEFQMIGFDELTQHRESQYRYMFSRLRRDVANGARTRMRGATNPGGEGHEWVQARFGIPDDGVTADVHWHNGRAFVPSALEDNPHIDRADYERKLTELDPITHAQLRRGKWVRDTSGLVYWAFSSLANVVDRLPELPYGQRWTYVLGIDYGNVNATALVELAFAQHHPNVYATRAEEWENLIPSEAAEIVREWDRAIGGYDRMVGDVGGLGKGYAEEARRRFTLPIAAAQKADKLGYIKLCNGDYAGKRLFLLRSCEALIERVRQLPWADEKRIKEHPAFPNHLTDAKLYGWREARHWQWEQAPRTNPELDDVERTEVERFEAEQARDFWGRAVGR